VNEDLGRVKNSTYAVEGHAILCDNDCISDGKGKMPPFLRHAADWSYFQAHLDQAAIVVTGRLGHQAHPNKPGRQRLVFTSTAQGGFHRDGDVSFVDPARFSVQSAFQTIAPAGGMVAVTGGTAVFQWFAAHGGYHAFHLVRALGHAIDQGRTVFGTSSRSAEAALQAMGLSLSEKRWLHADDQIELQLFRRDHKPDDKQS
jgi:hypothetical protein